MIRLIALVFLSFVSLVQLTGQTYKIPLTTKIGGYPITNRIVIGLFEDSEFIPMGVPIQFTDYKVFEAEYMPEHSSDQQEKKLYSVSGFHEDRKFVIVDTNFNGDFSDEEVIFLEYDLNTYYKYAQKGIVPPPYVIDESTGTDDYPNNDLVICKRISNNNEFITLNQNVEIVPNFSLFPNPISSTDKIIENFPYSFAILNTQSMQASLTLYDTIYNISIQKDNITKSYSKTFFDYDVSNTIDTVQRINKGINTTFPDRVIKIGSRLFETEIDDKGTELSLTLKLQDSTIHQVYSRIEGRTLEHSIFQSLNIGRGTVLVHFWGSWCGACKQGYERLADIKLGNHKNLKIIGVAVENSVDFEHLKKIVDKNKLSWPHIVSEMRDSDGPHHTFGVSIYPTYLLFSDGLLVKSTGDLDLILDSL